MKLSTLKSTADEMPFSASQRTPSSAESWFSSSLS
jgi:hypothetical protein